MKRFPVYLSLTISVLLLAVVAAFASDPQRIAVLTAFDKEMEAVKSYMVPKYAAVTTSTINGTRFDAVYIQDHLFIFALSGQSMINAAMNTQLVNDRFRVDAVVFVGIAGRIEPEA